MKTCDTSSKWTYPQLVMPSSLEVVHSLSLDGLDQDVQVIVQPAILGAKFKNGSAGVHHSGVVATAKRFANLWKAVRGQFSG